MMEFILGIIFGATIMIINFASKPKKKELKMKDEDYIENDEENYNFWEKYVDEGSHRHIHYTIETELVGCMRDEKLNSLMQDISYLTKKLEQLDDNKILEVNYFDEVKKFKEKWLKGE